MNTGTTPPSAGQQVEAIRQVLDAIIDAVALGGKDGVPGGTLYATMMHHGFTLHRFEWIMGILVKAGRLEKRGHHYFAVKPKQP